MNEIPTCDLVNLLEKSIKIGEQALINKYAYELTCRLYVPYSWCTFEQMLESFGYKEINKYDSKQISIEEYVRKREK